MGQRVLVVEDDTDTAHVVRAYLERDGYDVEVARDGVTGLERALTDRPDLVVLDWMLPGLDGLSFLRTLRRDGALPVIMLTARTEEEDRIAGLEAGVDRVVDVHVSNLRQKLEGAGARGLVGTVRGVGYRLEAP